MRIDVYEYGRAREVARTPEANLSAIVEVTMADGRRVQFCVRPDGQVSVRGWNTLDVGAIECLTLYAPLPPVAP